MIIFSIKIDNNIFEYKVEDLINEDNNGAIKGELKLNLIQNES